jgi:hypothetical protein
MCQQLLDIDSVRRILPQTPVEEVPPFSGHKNVGGDADLILDYLDELFLFRDLEGVFPHQHLVHHDAQRPYIYLLVVFLSLQDLGADVERSSTECCAKSVVLVHRPPEVT